VLIPHIFISHYFPLFLLFQLRCREMCLLIPPMGS